MYKVLCGVPADSCSGANTDVNARMESKGGGRKLHSSHEEAFKCHARFLVAQGYAQVGSREFQLEDGPILVLTKKSRFGGRMRPGKSGEKGTSNRNMPVRGAGLVI